MPTLSPQLWQFKAANWEWLKQIEECESIKTDVLITLKKDITAGISWKKFFLGIKNTEEKLK